MMHVRARLLLASVLLVGACRSQGTAGTGTSTSVGTASPSSLPAPVKAIASASASAAPLHAGSLPNGTREERERALLSFVESGQAVQVEVVATESGAKLDRSLRRALRLLR